jgi:hypothetical protein
MCPSGKSLKDDLENLIPQLTLKSKLYKLNEAIPDF